MTRNHLSILEQCPVENNHKGFSVYKNEFKVYIVAIHSSDGLYHFPISNFPESCKDCKFQKNM